ncbi:MAG: hypothetical protein KC503_05475, partial [Myxococcales bacterium]|nr:hypothetical protein [Myxococcales bacterium]
FGGDGAGEQGCSAIGVASAAHAVVFARVSGSTTIAQQNVADSDGQLVLRMTPATGGFDGVFAYGAALRVNDAIWDSAGVVAGGQFKGTLELGTKTLSSQNTGPDGMLWRLTLP